MLCFGISVTSIGRGGPTFLKNMMYLYNSRVIMCEAYVMYPKVCHFDVENG